MRQYQSRLSEVEEKRSIKSAAIFGGLTLLIIILALFMGIPLFSKFVSLFSKKTTNTLNLPATTLLPPSLIVLPQYTKDKSIVVKGTAIANSTVKVFFNNSSDETSADDTGNFALNVSLTPGPNVIFSKTVDAKSNESASSASYTITYLNKVPNLTINVPQNNQTFYGSTQQNISIQGSTDQGDTVTVNDHIAVLDNAGKFNFSFTLQNGDNQLKIISADPAGNKKEIDLKVTFNP